MSLFHNSFWTECFGWSKNIIFSLLEGENKMKIYNYGFPALCNEGHGCTAISFVFLSLLIKIVWFLTKIDRELICFCLPLLSYSNSCLRLVSSMACDISNCQYFSIKQVHCCKCIVKLMPSCVYISIDYINENPVGTVKSTFGWKPPETCFSLLSSIIRSSRLFACGMGAVDICLLVPTCM